MAGGSAFFGGIGGIGGGGGGGVRLSAHSTDGESQDDGGGADGLPLAGVGGIGGTASASPGDGGIGAGGGGGHGDSLMVFPAGGNGGFGGGGGGGGGGYGEGCGNGPGGAGGEFGGRGGEGQAIDDPPGPSIGGGGAGLGGGILAFGGRLLLQNVTITDCYATGGYAGYGGWSLDHAGTDGQGLGGALFLDDDVDADGYAVTLSDNFASSGSGYGFAWGLFTNTVDLHRTLRLSDAIFADGLEP